MVLKSVNLSSIFIFSYFHAFFFLTKLQPNSFQASNRVTSILLPYIMQYMIVNIVTLNLQFLKHIHYPFKEFSILGLLLFVTLGLPSIQANFDNLLIEQACLGPKRGN